MQREADAQQEEDVWPPERVHGTSSAAHGEKVTFNSINSLLYFTIAYIQPQLWHFAFLLARYGIKTIYFATDDSSLFAAADGIRAWPQFHWLHLPPPNAKLHGGYSDAKLKGGEIDGCVISIHVRMLRTVVTFMSLFWSAESKIALILPLPVC